MFSKLEMLFVHTLRKVSVASCVLGSKVTEGIPVAALSVLPISRSVVAEGIERCIVRITYNVLAPLSAPHLICVEFLKSLPVGGCQGNVQRGGDSNCTPFHL